MKSTASSTAEGGREQKLELALSGLKYWRRRLQLGIGFEALCEAAGVSSAALTHLERGHRRIPEEAVSRVEDALTAAEHAQAAVGRDGSPVRPGCGLPTGI